MARPSVIRRLTQHWQFKADLQRAERYRARMGYDQPLAERANLARRLAQGNRVVDRPRQAQAARVAPACIPIH